ncbi:hypothetical protein INS49_010082 [Diaporthe citri]|uniref:uncharacterized protein n=1 Tax=Diaporthe citri TaxID=83186 RepID=UPI001C803B08|nr:uncharacterized protein INS49_010082 [Diaporthe citri]KAG6361853.1 hypothetical protein INS49_010082 [Diaporthe citri]
MSIAFLHDHCNIIHTDIKPQNILVETPEIDDMFENAPSDVLLQDCRPLNPSLDYYMESEPVMSAHEDLASTNELSVRLGDFGVASWFNRHLTEWIQPEKLRAPEVILGAPWAHKVDIWNLGLVATAADDYSAEAHLAQMVSIFGPLPKSLLEQSERGYEYFDENGLMRGEIRFGSRSLREIGGLTGALSGQDEEYFVAFIQSMLALEPDDRPEARELLSAPWLVDHHSMP